MAATTVDWIDIGNCNESAEAHHWHALLYPRPLGGCIKQWYCLSVCLSVCRVHRA